MNSNFFKLLTAVALGIMIIGGAVQASWEGPTEVPPNGNRPRPLNESDLPQGKSGALRLINNADGTKNAGNSMFFYGLLMKDQSPLVFGDPLAKHVGFKASSTIITSTIWTLPITDGINGYVLTTNGLGQLGWSNPVDLITTDPDWRYAPNGDAQNFTSIYSERLTRIGANGTRNYVTGDGDLYVQNKLEVDGLIYEQSAPGANAEIDIKSGNNTHWGIYQHDANGDLRFWNTNDNVTFTTNGRVGIGANNNNPAQALDVAGGIKLSGLLFDGSGNAGSAGQLLSRNASNIQWIDPTWWTETGYIYATQNTRVGNTGTVNYANGAGDLYVQNDLEVDGTSYLENIVTTGLNLNFPNGVIPFQGPSGLAYDANNLIWNNTSKRLGLGTASTTDFTLQVAGDIGPNTNNTYNLGSAAKRWANIFANNLNITGGLDLGFTAGSVIFQGATALSQNNSKFFWDNTNNRLGLGTNTPAQTLDVAGNIKIPDTSYNFSEGVIFLGGDTFIHGSVKSLYADQVDWLIPSYSNTYVGREAGAFVPSTYDTDYYYNDLYDNSALGFWALKDNQAYANTAVGSRALASSTSGFGNSAFGSFSAVSNLGGSLNSSFGYYSAFSNISGNYNTAFGVKALYANTASNNTAFGAYALESNTSGAHNTALGIRAGQNNTTGFENLFLADRAGVANTTGNKNIYIGYYAGYLHATGNDNVFLGHNAAYNNVAGSNIVAIGSGAGRSSSGGGNTFIGYQAGYSAGSNTVAIGSGAGYSSEGGSNVFIGYQAGYNEIGSNKLYIEPGNADNNNALVYGQFYSAATTTSPLLRFNGKVGIAPRGTSNFTPNRLLHIYSPQNATNDADNAEIDIQSVSGTNKHWAIFQHRNTEFLTFWNNNIKSTPAIQDEEDILTLATVGLDKKIPAVGIGTGLDEPYSHLEVRNKAGLNDHGLTLSSYTQSALGSLSGGAYGSNVVVFRSGRYKVETGGDNTYQAYNGAIIYGGFKDMADGISQSDYKNARLGIQTLTDVGGLSDTIVAQNVRVGIAGNIMRDKTLTVHGSTWSEDYWSDNGRSIGEKGNSGYVCVAVPTSGPTVAALRLRFEDGLYICSCDCGATCCATNCTCNNP